jgi:sporadic carbohydrate cluster protein (TIGR04323 family)
MADGWDCRTVDYEPGRHPFLEWARSSIRALGCPVDDLERLHEHLDPAEAVSLCSALSATTARGHFAEIYQAFVRDVVGPLLPGPLAVQRLVNVRVHLPRQPRMNVPFHTDGWYGHGPGERNVWIPLAGGRGSAGLQVVDLARSRQLVASAVARRLEVAAMTAEFLAHSRPANLRDGQALLFTPGHLHGTVTNETDHTRVSLDFRVAPAGCELGKKWMGGYFRLLDDAGCDERCPGTPCACTSYVNNCTPRTRFIPIHLQRMMIAQHAERVGLRVTAEALEIEVMPHLPTLLHILEEGRPSGVVLFSIHALPPGGARRERLFEAAIRNRVPLHFANEGLLVSTPASRDRVEALLRFAGGS